jgi:hypothetical protein
MSEPAEPQSAAELFPSLEKLARDRRRKKVPFVQQLEATDCGAACLAMVLGHLGRDVNLDEVREAAGGSARDGTDALAIVRAAEWYGLRSRGLAIDLDHLRFLPPGSILHWEFNHFVVFERVTKKGIEIVDPAAARTRGRVQRCSPARGVPNRQFGPRRRAARCGTDQLSASARAVAHRDLDPAPECSRSRSAGHRGDRRRVVPRATPVARGRDRPRLPAVFQMVSTLVRPLAQLRPTSTPADPGFVDYLPGCLLTSSSASRRAT